MPPKATPPAKAEDQKPEHQTAPDTQTEESAPTSEPLSGDEKMALAADNPEATLRIAQESEAAEEEAEKHPMGKKYVVTAREVCFGHAIKYAGDFVHSNTPLPKELYAPCDPVAEEAEEF